MSPQKNSIILFKGCHVTIACSVTRINLLTRRWPIGLLSLQLSRANEPSVLRQSSVLTLSGETARRQFALRRSLLRSHRRPGGLGALPPRGSHRPVRARIRAYGSSDHGFATFRHPVLLSVPVSVTRGSDFDASVVVLKNGSMIRRLASLQWLQQGAVHQLQRYYQDAMTS
jgi:hypothetical protein